MAGTVALRPHQNDHAAVEGADGHEALLGAGNPVVQHRVGRAREHPPGIGQVETTDPEGRLPLGRIEADIRHRDGGNARRDPEAPRRRKGRAVALRPRDPFELDIGRRRRAAAAMHPIVLDGLAMLLKASSFEVVARCRTGEEARAALAGDINIAVHNIQMPKATGLELLRALRGAGLTRPKIVILIASLERAQLVEAVELETDGLVLKETAGERIVHRSEEVAAGRQWIDNDALLRVVGELARREARAAVTKPLSEREAEVAELAAQDLRNRDIALALGLSESTVKMHLRNVCTKLGVGSRAELAAFPREHRRTSCPLGSADADAVLDQDPDAEAD